MDAIRMPSAWVPGSTAAPVPGTEAEARRVALTLWDLADCTPGGRVVSWRGK